MLGYPPARIVKDCGKADRWSSVYDRVLRPQILVMIPDSHGPFSTALRSIPTRPRLNYCEVVTGFTNSLVS
jgi:hypothetical protein